MQRDIERLNPTGFTVGQGAAWTVFPSRITRFTIQQGLLDVGNSSCQNRLSSPAGHISELPLPCDAVGHTLCDGHRVVASCYVRSDGLQPISDGLHPSSFLPVRVQPSSGFIQREHQAKGGSLKSCRRCLSNRSVLKIAPARLSSDRIYPKKDGYSPHNSEVVCQVPVTMCPVPVSWKHYNYSP